MPAEEPVTLGRAQRLFTSLVAQFILDVYKFPGYAITFGEAYRTPQQAVWNAQKGIGIVNSLHTKRLAVDLNLFIGEQYMNNSDDYKGLGMIWKTYHPRCRWGGDFASPDGNHFSFEWEGVK